MAEPMLVARPPSNMKYTKTEKKKKDAGEVHRYRAGHKPTWLDDKDLEASSDEEGLTLLKPKAPLPDEAVIEAKSDPRLERIRQAKEHLLEEGGRRRRVRVCEVVEDEEEEDEVEKRRREARERIVAERAAVMKEEAVEPDTTAEEVEQRHARLLAKKQAGLVKEVEVLDRGDDDIKAPVAEEEESEYEEVTESESEEQPEERALMKAVFVPKQNRITILDQRRFELEQEELEEKARRLKEKRKADAHRMVIDEIHRMQDQAMESDSEGELPNDDDDLDEAIAYEEWKLREMQRIRRYKEERQAQEMEKMEIERRRNLTDEQRRWEDIKYDEKLRAMGLKKKGELVKWNFLQKYYHKGAFYQDTKEKGLTSEGLYNRDYGHAVGEDRFNKELLPKVKQVKNFGKIGQVKWTHLTNEDTSMPKDKEGNLLENPWAHKTFANTRNAISENTAYQLSSNTAMFQHGRAGRTRETPIGSASFGTAGKVHKDEIVSRPSKRLKR